MFCPAKTPEVQAVGLGRNLALTGVNAIACHGGYNQEDSLMMNKLPMDEALAGPSSSGGYKEADEQGGIVREEIEKPDPDCTVCMKHSTCGKLDKGSLLAPGAHVSREDTIVGKITATSESKHDGQVPQEGHVTGAVPCRERRGTPDDVDHQQIRGGLLARHLHSIPTQVGDNFTSRHWQKGTVGITYTWDDMPFSASEGTVWDLVVNPHATPSRLTLGHLVEALMSKVASLMGNEGDATPFMDAAAENNLSTLHKLGY